MTATFTGIVKDAEQIIGFADAFIVLTLRAADAAKIRTEGCVAQSGKGSGERVRNFIRCRTATNRVRVCHQRNASGRPGVVHQHFDLAHRAIDQNFFFTYQAHDGCR